MSEHADSDTLCCTGLKLQAGRMLYKVEWPSEQDRIIGTSTVATVSWATLDVWEGDGEQNRAPMGLPE